MTRLSDVPLCRKCHDRGRYRKWILKCQNIVIFPWKWAKIRCKCQHPGEQAKLVAKRAAEMRRPPAPMGSGTNIVAKDLKNIWYDGVTEVFHCYDQAYELNELAKYHDQPERFKTNVKRADNIYGKDMDTALLQLMVKKLLAEQVNRAAQTMANVKKAMSVAAQANPQSVYGDGPGWPQTPMSPPPPPKKPNLDMPPKVINSW